MAQQQQGPFDEYINPNAKPRITQPVANPTGYEGTATGFGQIAANFMKGLSEGRAQKFQDAEMKRARQDAMLIKARDEIANGDYLPDVKREKLAKIDDLMRRNIVQETKGTGFGKFVSAIFGPTAKYDPNEANEFLGTEYQELRTNPEYRINPGAMGSKLVESINAAKQRLGSANAGQTEMTPGLIGTARVQPSTQVTQEMVWNDPEVMKVRESMINQGIDPKMFSGDVQAAMSDLQQQYAPGTPEAYKQGVFSRIAQPPNPAARFVTMGGQQAPQPPSQPGSNQPGGNPIVTNDELAAAQIAGVATASNPRDFIGPDGKPFRGQDISGTGLSANGVRNVDTGEIIQGARNATARDFAQGKEQVDPEKARESFYALIDSSVKDKQVATQLKASVDARIDAGAITSADQLVNAYIKDQMKSKDDGRITSKVTDFMAQDYEVGILGRQDLYKEISLAGGKRIEFLTELEKRGIRALTEPQQTMIRNLTTLQELKRIYQEISDIYDEVGPGGVITQAINGELKALNYEADGLTGNLVKTFSGETGARLSDQDILRVKFMFRPEPVTALVSKTANRGKIEDLVRLIKEKDQGFFGTLKNKQRQKIRDHWSFDMLGRLDDQPPSPPPAGKATPKGVKLTSKTPVDLQNNNDIWRQGSKVRDF